MSASLGPSTPSQPLQQQATASSNGPSASTIEIDVPGSPSVPQLRQLPGHFEDVEMEDLVVLIGQKCVYNMLDDPLISSFHCYPCHSRSFGPNNRAQRPDTAQRVSSNGCNLCFHCCSFRRRRYNHSDTLTRFHSRSPPAITVLDYLKRVVRYIPRIEVRLLLPPPAQPRTFYALLN